MIFFLQEEGAMMETEDQPEEDYIDDWHEHLPKKYNKEGTDHYRPRPTRIWRMALLIRYGRITVPRSEPWSEERLKRMGFRPEANVIDANDNLVITEVKRLGTERKQLNLDKEP